MAAVVVILIISECAMSGCECGVFRECECECVLCNESECEFGICSSECVVNMSVC